jgi:hypothetical protein
MNKTDGVIQSSSPAQRVLDEIAFRGGLLRLNAAIQTASGPGASPVWNAQETSETLAFIEHSIAPDWPPQFDASAKPVRRTMAPALAVRPGNSPAFEKQG